MDRVLSKSKQLPIAYATIRILDSEFVTNTDQNGGFHIEIPANFSNKTLVISHIGYYDYEIKLQGIPTDIKILLEEEVKELKEVKVISPQKLKLKEVRKSRRDHADIFYKISLDSAVNLAHQEKKQVLIYFTAKWCGPCTWMSLHIFPDSQVQEMLRKSYIPLKIDVDRLGANKIADTYNIFSMPTFIVIDQEKQIRKKHRGSADKATFLKFLQMDLSPTPLQLSEAEIKFQAKIKAYRKRFRPNPGLALGLNSLGDNLGFSSSIFLAMEKRRLLWRPSIDYSQFKINDSRLNFVGVSVDLGYSFHKTALFKFSGGFRVMVSPYYGWFTNSSAFSPNTDYGLRYGVEGYFGSDSRIGLSLQYNHGFKNIPSGDGGENQIRGWILKASLMF